MSSPSPPFSGRWPRRRTGRVRFAEVVPGRADRKDLRRRFRKVARTVRVERKSRVTAGLRGLAARRVPVASVRTGVLGDEVLEFTDGTRVWLDVRDGTTVLRRLAGRSGRCGLYLRAVDPCFGFCWYQLGFGTAGSSTHSVLARVKQYQSGATWIRWAPAVWWSRARREQPQE